MNDDCPKELGGAEVIAYAIITSDNKWTGKTKHIVDGNEIGIANAMVITRYPDEENYYVFGCYSQNWEPKTDTWHENLEDAIDQLDWEYQGLSKNLIWYNK